MKKEAKLQLLITFYKTHGFDLYWNDVETLQRFAKRLQTNALNVCNTENYEDKRPQIMARFKLLLSDKIPLKM